MTVLRGALVDFVEGIERLVGERVGDLARELGLGFGKEAHAVSLDLEV
jgi:hypothetical protein